MAMAVEAEAEREKQKAIRTKNPQAKEKLESQKEGLEGGSRLKWLWVGSALRKSQCHNLPYMRPG